jgi:hypothetical protein
MKSNLRPKRCVLNLTRQLMSACRHLVAARDPILGAESWAPARAPGRPAEPTHTINWSFSDVALTCRYRILISLHKRGGLAETESANSY